MMEKLRYISYREKSVICKKKHETHNKISSEWPARKIYFNYMNN